jgi:hypothetical protein
MSAVSTQDDPQLHAAVRSCVQALRRLAEYTLSPALDRYIRELGERKESLSAAEHEHLLALVGFTQQRTLDKLQADLALRQLQPFFPEETGA